MANLGIILASVVLLLWNCSAINAVATRQVSDHGKPSTSAENPLIIDGLLPKKPENERDSMLRRQKRGTSTTNQTQGPSFSDGFVRVDVQFPKKTGNVSTEFQEVLSTLERIESSLKKIEAGLPNSLGSGNGNETRPGHLSWTDCWDVLRSGHNISGVYMINTLSRAANAFPVYCNMDTHGGGWTVIQTRKNGQTNFYQDWKHYKEGFGNTDDEYWLGLERIHQMTNSKHYELLIELEDSEESTRYGIWNRFVLGSEALGYHISELGAYRGDAGDSLTAHANMKFTTWDVDNDANEGNCARMYTGAWWYKSCFVGHLNGLYLRGAEYNVYAQGIIWEGWRGFYYSLKGSRMSIRPRSVAGS